MTIDFELSNKRNIKKSLFYDGYNRFNIFLGVLVDF